MASKRFGGERFFLKAKANWDIKHFKSGELYKGKLTDTGKKHGKGK